MYCDFLCDHTGLVVNYVQEVVLNFPESPVQDFVMSMHSSPSSSSLLLQAIVSRCDRLRQGASSSSSPSPVVFLLQALRAVEHSHPHQSGQLLLFLTRSYLLSPFTALARESNAVACSRVESVLRANDSDTLKQMIEKEELSDILDLLRSTRIFKRYSRLVSLLNR